MKVAHRMTKRMSPAMNVFWFVWSHPLTRGARVKALARVAGWQIRSRLQREVIVPWIANQKLAVKRGMAGATGNIYVGLHEFPDMSFLLHFLKSGDLFLDIGANVGTYTVLASGVCKAHTWAFEPDPKTVRALKRNIEVNGLQELVTVHEFALGATQREVAFTIGLDTVNRVATAGQLDCQLVQQKQLDSLIGESEPVFAKLDVEGYEGEVLRGGQAFLAKASLQAIELETATPGIHEMLSEYQFVRAFYNPFKRMLSTDPVGLQASNALFVKDFAFVNDRINASSRIRVLDVLL
jgi:FkbM family methyltransferase